MTPEGMVQPGRRRAIHGPSRARRVASLAEAWVRVVVGASAALISSPVTRRGREAVLRLAGELGHAGTPGPEEILPPVPATAVALDRTPIIVREPVARDGNVTLLELLVINRIVAARRPRRLFEIGSFDFRTTVNLAANALPGAEIFTLDLPSDGRSAAALRLDRDDPKYIGRGQVLARTATADESSRIRSLQGDSATFDFAPYAGRMDLIFVDGAHSYEYVHRDSASALMMAAPGALILWHDYGVWPGVTGALNELFLTDPRFHGLRRVEHTTLVLLDLAAAN